MFSRRHTIEVGADTRQRAPRILPYRLRAEVSDGAVPGGPAGAWTYNGRRPGPLMRSRPGDRIQVDVENDLPEATTLVWQRADEPETTSTLSTTIRSRDRQLVTMEVTAPGLYWYHPSDPRQTERGLYGAILADDPAERRALGILTQNDKILLLDGSRRSRPGTPPTVLVNGRLRPTINVRNGVLHRLRFLNIGSGGAVWVSLGGGQPVWTLPFERTTGIELGPGEGADLLWLPSGNHRDRVPLRWCGAPGRRFRAGHNTTGIVADFRLVGHRGAAPRAGAPPRVFGSVPAGRAGSDPAVNRRSGSVALTP